MRFMFVDADTGMFKSIMDPALTKPTEASAAVAATPAPEALPVAAETHEPPATTLPRDYFVDRPA